MGSTFENCHVRATDTAPIIAALRSSQRQTTGFVAKEAVNGWVSVIADERTNTSDMAEELSTTLQTVVLFLWEYDSDACGYVLFDSGARRDLFDSNPDLWVGEPDEDDEEILPMSPEERAEVAGSPSLLLPYCLPGTTEDDIRAALGTTGDEAHESLFEYIAASNHQTPEEARAGYIAGVDASLGRSRRIFEDSYGEEFFGKQSVSAEDILSQPDADGIVYALTELLGLDPEIAMLSCRDVAQGNLKELGVALMRV